MSHGVVEHGALRRVAPRAAAQQRVHGPYVAWLEISPVGSAQKGVQVQIVKDVRTKK